MYLEEMEKAKSARLAALKASMEARTAEICARQRLYQALGADGAEANDEALRPLWAAANAAIQKAAVASSEFHKACEAEREAIANYHYHRGLTAGYDA